MTRPAEFVWDYPRPPRLERSQLHVVVSFAGAVVADTTKAMRVCETASPPTYYLPPADVDGRYLVPAQGRSVCEWKGPAVYYDVVVGERRADEAAWAYPDPWSGFERLAGYLAFYPSRVHCTLDDEVVQPQPGGFYGGWVTHEIRGPWKGEPGTQHW